MKPENIFLVYDLSVHDNEVHHRLAGKFLLHDGNFQIIEDHGLPPALESCSPADGADIIHKLSTSQYCRIINLADVLKGSYPDLIPHGTVDADAADEMQNQEAHFDYHRVGHPAPQRLIVDANGGAFLDGHLLTPEEANRLKAHVGTKMASLKRLTTPLPMAKSEGGWTPDQTLGYSHEHPKLFNRYSLRQFEDTKPGGSWTYVNGHGTGDMAHQYGDKVATQAVQALGRHIKGSADGDAKVFHVHGDQFVVHHPTPEHSMVFARKLRDTLEKVPAVNGTHRLTAAVGIGPDRNAAHATHQTVRAERNAKTPRPGQGGTFVRVHPDFKGY